MPYDTVSSVEEIITSLFQPDVLLPAQYETLRRKSYPEPEKRLMLAVLEDAVVCFQRYMFSRDSKGKGLFRDAEEWLLKDSGDWIFSFENVCEVLGFNPEYVRQGVLRWKEKQVAQRSKAKVYRLSPRPEVIKAGLERSRCAEEGLQKVVGR